MKNKNVLIPIILELDEELSSEEQMTGIKTIGIKEDGRSYLGYVAIIKDFAGFNKIRLGNLKAIEYTRKKLGKLVI